MLEDVISPAPPVVPLIDDASQAVLAEAVASLGSLRALQWLGEGGSQLHILASLRDQIELAVGHAVTLADEQGYTEAAIARLLGLGGETGFDFQAGGEQTNGH